MYAIRQNKVFPYRVIEKKIVKQTLTGNNFNKITTCLSGNKNVTMFNKKNTLLLKNCSNTSSHLIQRKIILLHANPSVVVERNFQILLTLINQYNNDESKVFLLKKIKTAMSNFSKHKYFYDNMNEQIDAEMYMKKNMFILINMNITKLEVELAMGYL